MRNFLFAASALIVAACSTIGLGGGGQPAPAQAQAAAIGDSAGQSSWWWPFGGGDAPGATADVPQLGVNAYLWRATLDTLTFMPLASEDPLGGVIITDWYSAPENPNERMKVTAYILDRRLRADALKVAVFRQARTVEGWVDVAVNPETPVRLENAILTRARELHLSLVQ
jgi:hypothetical protein